MNNIVIAFPKKEVANSIKKILAQSGYTVTAVANTGASALSSMNGIWESSYADTDFQT